MPQQVRGSRPDEASYTVPFVEVPCACHMARHGKSQYAGTKAYFTKLNVFEGMTTH